MRKQIRLIGIIGSVVLLSWWITQPKKLNDTQSAPIIVPISNVLSFDSILPPQLLGDSTSNQHGTDTQIRGLALGSFTSAAELHKAFSTQSILDTISILKVMDSQKKLWYYAAIGPFKTKATLQQKQKEMQTTFGMQPTVIVWPHTTTKQKYRLKL